MIKITIHLRSNKIFQQVELLLTIVPKIFKILHKKPSKLIGRQGGIITEDKNSDVILADYNVEK